MAFTAETKNAIEFYVTAHIPGEQWHRDFFSFVRNPALAGRLGDEFLSVRYLYKVLEGLVADSWCLGLKFVCRSWRMPQFMRPSSTTCCSSVYQKIPAWCD